MSFASIHWPLILQVQSTIQGLTTGGAPRLAGVPSANVLARPVPYMLDFTQQTPLPTNKKAWPAIVCCYWDVEAIDAWDNATDSWMFPVLVAMGKVSDGPDASNDDFKSWRETILQVFRPRAFSIADPATTFYDVQSVPGPLIDPRSWLEKDAVCGSLGLKFYTRRTRG